LRIGVEGVRLKRRRGDKEEISKKIKIKIKNGKQKS
jgi:hypothetical protein